MNNLLTAMLGNISLALRKLDVLSPVLKHLQAVESASYSASDLCKQMLAYSGKGKFVVKAINLSDLVEDMGKLIDVSLAKNVVLKYHLTDQLPPMDADVAQNQDEIVLVMLDMTMPKMGGEACFSQLKHICPDVSVILSSGYNEQDATSRFAGKGLAGFLQKPYTPEALEEKVQDILNDS